MTISRTLLLGISISLLGCSSQSAPEAGGRAGVQQATANCITGKVTLPDGKPLPGKVKEINIAISGISDKAGYVYYTPVVNEDGAYRQQVVAGQYTFETSTIKVEYNGATFLFNLEPVGTDWNKRRDVAAGLVQDFHWHANGPTPYGKENGKDPNNHTHWYGLCVGFKSELYRDDIKARPPAIPVNSKLTFTFTPAGEMIDGSRPDVPVVFERTYTGGVTDSYDANDLLPGKYTVTAIVTLPDMTEKKLLLQGPGDYPHYKPVLEITARPEKGRSFCEKPLCNFVLE